MANYYSTLLGYRELAKEIHQTAVEHGWWENERDISEVVALIHSELSEALEEYRNDKPLVYYVIGSEIKTDWKDNKYDGEKPEGVAIELADAVIRILDYAGKMNMPLENDDEYETIWSDMSLPKLISHCHIYLSHAYMEHLQGYKREPISDYAYFAELIKCIHAWVELNGYNLDELIELKHKYNKNRPYRHGNKKC